MYSGKQILNVSYPIFLGLLAQNVINVTDTAFLGRVGEVELGASAMGGLYYISVFTIAFGFSTGSQIVIARRNGEGRYDQIGPVMTQGVFFLLALATLAFLFSRLFAEGVMGWLISSDAILKATMDFLDWRVIGFFFSFMSVMFRALYAYESADHQRRADGGDECRARLSIDFRTCGFPEDGHPRGGDCFRYRRGGVDSLPCRIYTVDGGYTQIRVG